MVAIQNTLVELLASLRRLEEAPSERGLALEIQERLIRLIRQAERNLRRAKKAVRTSRRPGEPQTHGPAQARKRARLRKEHALARRDHYRDLLIVLRCIGDGIAFIYIDKYEIKPLSFKEPPGFLTGKAGLRTELRILRSVFGRGGIALLNDLTNCLRYADLTFITPEGFSLFEVKSAGVTSERIERQLGKIKAITDYLLTDTAVGLYGVAGTAFRKAPPRTEVNHIGDLNRLIARGQSEGFALNQVEPGLRYVVSTRVPSESEWREVIHGLTRPVLLPVNDAKLRPRGHFPFTLSIRDPEAAVSFLYGEFVISVVLDADELVRDFNHHGWSLEATWTGDYPLWIQRSYQNEPMKVGLSRHWFERLCLEFVGLAWWVEASADVHVPKPDAHEA